MRIAEAEAATNHASVSDLRPTAFLDHGSDEVWSLIDRTLTESQDTDVRKAVALYYAVRDGLRYDVYNADMSRTGLKASTILKAGGGMCIHKSVVYSAALRAVGVPSRLVLTDVRNHLTSDQLKQLVGGDVFYYHCLTSVYLEGRWVRVTPVFNKRLCLLYGITPLEFDGTADSVHHPYDMNGRRHMEFLKVHGEFDDLPYDDVINGLRHHHPRLFATKDRFTTGSLTADALRKRVAQPSTVDNSSADGSE